MSVLHCMMLPTHGFKPWMEEISSVSHLFICKENKIHRNREIVEISWFSWTSSNCVVVLSWYIFLQVVPSLTWQTLQSSVFWDLFGTWDQERIWLRILKSVSGTCEWKMQLGNHQESRGRRKAIILTLDYVLKTPSFSKFCHNLVYEIILCHIQCTEELWFDLETWLWLFVVIWSDDILWRI